MPDPQSDAISPWRLDRVSLLLGCFAVGAVLVSSEIDIGLRGGVNDVVFDQYQRWKPREYDSDLPVRIIDIDRRSLALFGQWPWPRTYLAAMLDRLSDAEPAAIGFDMVFAEPDRTSPELALAVMQARDGTVTVPSVAQFRETSHDVAFANAIARGNVVLGALLSSDATGEDYHGKASFSVVGPDPADSMPRVDGIEMPIEILAERASGIGAVGFMGTGGLVARKFPMTVVYNSEKVPALPLEVLRLALGTRGYLLKSTGASGEAGSTDAPGVVGIRVGPLEVPLSSDARLRVHYAGHQIERIIPAWEILSNADADAPWRAAVTGKILLIGSSASGVSQVIDTPIATAQLGVEVTAEVIEQILSGDYLERPYWAHGAERFLVLFFGLLVTYTMARSHPVGGAIVTVAAIYFAAGSSWFAFNDHGLLLGPVFPALGSAVPFVLVGAVNYARTDAEKRAIRDQFEHFLAPEVITEISANPQKYLTPGGEERDLSILFCDVRDFSTITENMPPQQVIRFVNRFLTPISGAIIENGGTIDKFIGDAVMAFWNAPRRTEDYVAQAVRGTFAIRRTVDDLNRAARKRGEPEITIGVGLNNGPCSVGFMGSERRLEYSCIGDQVNLAARFEGLTKQYGVWNCAGQTALADVPHILAVELDLVVVRGFTRPTPVWTLLSDDESFDPALVEAAALLDTARGAFIGRRWNDAEEAFRQLSALRPPGFDPKRIVKNYLARIALYREVPPPDDWNGAFWAPEK